KTYNFLFFFSSRRRHTRCLSDWSSDVCSSDLQKKAPIYNNSQRVEVVSQDPEADAERILRAFATRAFRRTVTDDDIRPFVKLVKIGRASCRERGWRRWVGGWLG